MITHQNAVRAAILENTHQIQELNSAAFAINTFFFYSITDHLFPFSTFIPFLCKSCVTIIGPKTTSCMFTRLSEKTRRAGWTATLNSNHFTVSHGKPPEDTLLHSQLWLALWNDSHPSNGFANGSKLAPLIPVFGIFFSNTPILTSWQVC